MADIRILFVCYGNTCRSPMAEALARRLAHDAGRSDMVFASAGIAPRTTGGGADPRAVECLARRDIDLAHHLVRALDAAADAGAYDFVLTLDEAVHGAVLAQTPLALHGKVRPLMACAADREVSEVADPYHGTAADYDRALGLIERGVVGLLAAGLSSPR